MGFQSGNQIQRLGHATRVLEARIKRILLEDGYASFDRAVRKQMKKAEAGDLASLEWITSRHDGKQRSDDSASDSETRSIPLSQLVSAILAARKADAIDAPEVIANDDQPAILPPVSEA